MNAGRWIAILLTVLVVAAGVLFTVQNGSRRTDLSLDVGVAAVHLRQPQPVPLLLWSAFGIGVVVGAGAALALRRRRASGNADVLGPADDLLG